MVAKTFTLTNYTASPITINEIEFESVAGIPHVADLSNFGGYLSGSTSFTNNSTYPTVNVLYVSDTSPVTKLYASHTGTTLVVNNTTGIASGYVLSGNGYTSGQTVATVVSATNLLISAAPTFAPTVGQGITFSTSSIILVVNSTAGISNGFVASGNGYTLDQTVVSVDSVNQLTMSALPNGTPTIGGTISFRNPTPIGTIAAGASIPFTLDYTTSLLEVSTNTARVNVITASGTEIVRTAIVLSTTPQPDPGLFFDPDNPLISVPPETTTGGTADGTTDGGGGGGGGICFVGDALVTLSDNTAVPINMLKVGDKVFNFDKTSVNTVTFIEQGSALDYEYLYAPYNEKPFATINHPLYINGKLLSVDPTQTSFFYPWLDRADKLEDYTVEAATDKPVYNLWVDGDGTYIVNNYGTTSIIGDGGLLRLASEAGYITKERVTEILLKFTKDGSATVLGAYLVNKYFGNLNIKFVNRLMGTIFKDKDQYKLLQKITSGIFKVVGLLSTRK
jgi:hypothetical protein